MILAITLLCISLSSAEYLDCIGPRKYRDEANFRYHSLRDYTSDQCATCYNYILADYLKVVDRKIKDPETGKEKIVTYRPYVYFRTQRSGLLKSIGNPTEPAREVLPEDFNRENPEDDPILSSITRDFQRKIFLDCCDGAVRCCTDRLQSRREGKLNHLEKPFCPATWDSWDCFPDTPAGTTVSQICPLFSLQPINREIPPCLRGYSSKICQYDGQWLRINGTEKTNYQECAFVGKYKALMDVNIRISLHSFSLVLVVVAAAILIAYKQYRILRIRIHLNFFLSLLLNSLGEILFYTLVRRRHLQSYNSNVVKNNEHWCIFLTILMKWSKLTNYSWMMCEGLYLYRLIVHAFKEQTRSWPFYVAGWILPMMCIIPYLIVHSQGPYNNNCWTMPMGSLEWIYYPLPLLSLFINCLLMANIVRVLCTKFRSSPKHFKTALRSVLLLIPVFGIHYIFYVSKGDLLETCDFSKEILLYISIGAECLQGAFIATIFCFVNCEVHMLIKRSLLLWLMKHPSDGVVTEETDLRSLPTTPTAPTLPGGSLEYDNHPKVTSTM